MERKQERRCSGTKGRILDCSETVRATIRWIRSFRKIFFTCFVAQILCCSAIGVEAQLRSEVVRAAALDEQGRFQEVIDLLAPLLDSPRASAHESEIGIGWNLLGVAFENTGKYDAARRSYERSVLILETVPSMKRQYASALDNLASLKSDTGQFSESKRLRLKALKLYSSLEDDSEVSRVLGNLAIIAIGEGKYRGAKSLLEDAFARIVKVPDLDPNDLAGLYSTKALLSLREAHFSDAVDAAGLAIALWSKPQGSLSYNRASCLAIRAEAYMGEKDHLNAAAADFLESLNIVDNIGARQTVVYYAVELKYARLLRDLGQTTEASLKETEANAGLLANQGMNCSHCSISAVGYR